MGRSLGRRDSTFGGPVAWVRKRDDVAAGASVQIPAGETIADNGTLSFATGDTVAMGSPYNSAAQITVNGTLIAAGTTFTAAANSTSNITVNPGGIITTTSSFKLPLFVRTTTSLPWPEHHLRPDRDRVGHPLQRRARPRPDRHQPVEPQLRLPGRLHGGDPGHGGGGGPASRSSSPPVRRSPTTAS